MNRHESTDIETTELVSRVRALIEGSSLGEEGPRLLSTRTSDKQLERIRRLRQRPADIGAGPSESSARRLIAEAMGGVRLPRRTPDPDCVQSVSGVSAVAHWICNPDPAHSGCYRNDSYTMVRVIDALRGSASCPT
ncbi:hypothetical protein [Nocardia fusca]|uniref:hypothetical protein n=1 Tax=Nocardia fusca TaxID=941183 RepID=UPI0007A7632F|nr:hypothetical protein [Nocardia fusca]